MNYYRVLEVSPKASTEVIHAAYRELAKKYRDNTKMLTEVNVAKDTLLDSLKRADYDKTIDPKTGKKIGPYLLIKTLAEGGFGKTYLAEHTTLKTQVCLKHAHRISVEDTLLLQEEARNIWDLRHFGIPAIRDILTLEDDSVVLVMSYIPGPTLAELIDKHSRIDPEHVAWITERVLNILKYIHYHGVVHGDVKPANIIVQPESHTVVLVDYGLSAFRPKKGVINKGYTPTYAAPEQIKGSALLPETDFYGLGLTLIDALGGSAANKCVPEYVPEHLCEFIKKLIRQDVLARPHWQKEDLIESLQVVRMKDFGRKASGMKALV